MAAANANMPDWPSNFAIYAVNPQNFYFMSIDPYSTNTLIGGRAQQQNLADIASNPFSSTLPLLLYGNVTSTTSFSTKGPNGQIRVELQLLQPAPTSRDRRQIERIPVGQRVRNLHGKRRTARRRRGLQLHSLAHNWPGYHLDDSRALSLSGRYESGFRHAILNGEQYRRRSLRIPAADRNRAQPGLLQLLRLQRNLAGRSDGNGNPADTQRGSAQQRNDRDHPIRDRLHLLRYPRKRLPGWRADPLHWAHYREHSPNPEVCSTRNRSFFPVSCRVAGNKPRKAPAGSSPQPPSSAPQVADPLQESTSSSNSRKGGIN